MKIRNLFLLLNFTKKREIIGYIIILISWQSENILNKMKYSQIKILGFKDE